MSCAACGGSRAEHLFRSASGYPIERCGGCGLVFTDARGAPPRGELHPEFDQSDAASVRAARSALEVFLRKRERVVRRFKPAGRLLDFGCGSGAFARFMAARGYDVVGLEPFSIGRPAVSERLELRRGSLDAELPRLGRFDVITLWHVLEHTERPAEVLRTLAGLLAPGGAVVVSVPNFASWQRRVFGGRWFHLDPPRHLVHFEPRSLRACLHAAGLEIAGEERYLPEYGSSGWVQSALNVLLPDPNVLYELVKDRGRASGGRGQIAASLALAVPLFGLSLPLEAIAAAAGGQAALTVGAVVGDSLPGAGA